MRSLLSTALLLALLALGGCGGSSTSDSAGFDPVFKDVKGLSAPAREAKLRELARSEGSKLVLYTSLIDQSARPLVQAFEKRYGIKVSLFRSESEPIAQRLSQEVKAGRRGTDVVETSGQDMVALNRLAAFVPYRPAALANLVPGAEQKGWTADRFNKFVVGWNTDLVKKGRQPRSVEDLAQPRWHGKVALEKSDADWYKTLHDYWVSPAGGKTAAEADRLFAGIARNARVAPSHAVMTELLGAGEFSVAATSYLHQLRDSVDKGAPVAYRPIAEPVLSRPNGVALLNSAEHPAAAVLFVEWLLGPDGQRELQRVNVQPALRGLESLPVKREIPVDVEGFADVAREWQDRYDALLRGSKRAGG
ncbi:MAG: iron(III) transport system substrate-binding protein [Thermoleophilaceae bacterium]|nr:iron(III) transport system substrate-binding protein [Thermoleophilaceae bacterium]